MNEVMEIRGLVKSVSEGTSKNGNRYSVLEVESGCMLERIYSFDEGAFAGVEKDQGVTVEYEQREKFKKFISIEKDPPETARKLPYTVSEKDCEIVVTERMRRTWMPANCPKGRIVPVVAGVTESGGARILLYRRSSFDVELLDELFGKDGWQLEYGDIKNGRISCSVKIFSTHLCEWITKEVTIREDEKTCDPDRDISERAFKKACHNLLGFGNELYTVPLVEVRDTHCEISPTGSVICRDTFRVSELEYDGRKIVWLKLQNQNGTDVFEYDIRSGKEGA